MQKQKKRKGMLKRMTAVMLVCCMVLSGNVMTVLAGEGITGIDNVVQSEGNSTTASARSSTKEVSGEGYGNTTEFAGGTGTEQDPYLIKSVEHFLNMENYIGVGGNFFKQLTDLDFTDYDFGSKAGVGGGFRGFSNWFYGTYNGGGYRWTGLKLTSSSSSGVSSRTGLFPGMDGTISDLILDNCIMALADAAAWGGFLVNQMQSGTISRVSVVSCTMSGGNGSTLGAGFLVGSLRGTSTIEDCKVESGIDLSYGKGSTGMIAGGIRQWSGTISRTIIVNTTCANRQPQIFTGLEYGSALSSGTLVECYYDSSVLSTTSGGRNGTPLPAEEFKKASFVSEHLGDTWIHLSGRFPFLGFEVVRVGGSGLSYDFGSKEVGFEGGKKVFQVYVSSNYYAADMEYLWYKDGKQIPPDDKKIIIDGRYSYLSFDALSLTDTGTYYCEVNNGNAKSKTAIIDFHVWKGEGSKTSPCLITSQADLEWVSYGMDLNYIQTVDIDFSNLKNAANVVPGNKTTIFSGLYDGGGHTISNLSLTGTYTKQIVGFFKQVSGVVKNINFTNLTLYNGFGSVGTVAQSLLGSGVVSNVSVSGVLQCWRGGNSSEPVYGGSGGSLCGVAAPDSIVQSCSSTMTITAGATNDVFVGGLIGTGGTVKNSYFAGKIVSGYADDYRSAFGVNAVVDNSTCFYDASVIANTVQSSSSGTAKTTAEIKSAAVVNALGTAFYLKDTNTYPLLTFDEVIYPSVLLTNLDNKPANVAVGETFTFESVFYKNGDGVSWQWYLDGNAIAGATSNSYTVTWEDKASGKYTCVASKQIGGAKWTYEVPFYKDFYVWQGGAGIKTDPFKVGTPKQLSNVGKQPAGFYEQISDIDMNGITDFQPNGYDAETGTVTDFAGVYDGKAYEIQNLSMTSSASNVGVFASVSGTVKNLGITGGTVKASGGAGAETSVGSLVGVLKGGTVSSCYNSGCTVEDTNASLTAVHYAGGIIGSIQGSGTVKNCYNQAAVKGASGSNLWVGGIIGYRTDTTSAVDNCYVTGALSGGSSRAPIVGTTSDTGLNNSYFDSNKVTGYNGSYGLGKGKDTTSMQQEAFATALGTEYLFDSSEEKGYPLLKFDNRAQVLNKTYPEDAAVFEGYDTEAAFTVKIEERGIPGIYTYEWYKEGSNQVLKKEVTKNLESTYKISNQANGGQGVWAGDSGNYFCIVTTGAGEVKSEKAKLTTQPEPGSPKYIAVRDSKEIESGSWGDKKVDITMGYIERDDGYTGVPKLYYRLGSHDAAWVEYKAGYSISTEGRTNIYGKAVYDDGVTKYAGFLVCIDTKAPVLGELTNSSVAGEQANSWDLLGKDIADGDGSGVNGYYVKMTDDGTTPAAPNGKEEKGWNLLEASDKEFTYEVSENGTYYVWLRDNAGNISVESSNEVTDLVPEITDLDTVYREYGIKDTAFDDYLRITPKGTTTRYAKPISVYYEKADNEDGKAEITDEMMVGYKSLTYAITKGSTLATVNNTGNISSKTQTGTLEVTITLTNYNGNKVTKVKEVLIRDEEAKIKTQPQSFMIKDTDLQSGTQNAVFTVIAEKGTNNQYLWFYSSDPDDKVGTQYAEGIVSDALSSTLTVPNIKIENDMTYIWCKVINTNNEPVVSDKVRIVVNSRPSVTKTTPSGETEGKLEVTVGKDGSMSVNAQTVSGDIFYQWQYMENNAWNNVPDNIKKEIEKTDKDGNVVKETVVDEVRSGHSPEYIAGAVKAEQNGTMYRCIVYNDGYTIASASAQQLSGNVKLMVRTAPKKPIMTLATDTENKSFESGKWNDEQFQFKMTPDGTVVGDTLLQYQIVKLVAGDDITNAAAKLSAKVDNTKNGSGAWTAVTSGAVQTVTQETGTKVLIFGRAINKWVYENEGVNTGETSGKVLMAEGAATDIYGNFEAWYDNTPATGTIKFGTAEKVYDSLIQKTQFNLFYKDALAVKVTGEDKESGISKIYYTWFTGKDQTAKTTDELSKLADGTGTAAEGKWNAYNDSGFAVNAADEGAKVIYAKIVNNAGTVTYISSEGFIMDSTAPIIADPADADYKKTDGTTAVTFATDSNESRWTAEESMKLQVNISDTKENVDDSGVDQWRYAFSETDLEAGVLTSMKDKDADWGTIAGGTAWKAYSSTATDNQINLTKNGFVYLQAVDKSGNMTEIKKIAVTQFDRTAPTFTISASNMKNGAEEWTNEDVTLSVADASDGSGSGLAEAAYWFTGQTADGYMSATSKAYGENGTYTVKVKDLVGNTTTQTYTIGKIDKTNPEITGTPTFTNATYNNEWLNETAANITVNIAGVSDKGDTIDKGDAGMEEQASSEVAGVYVQTAETGTDVTQALTQADGTYSKAIANPGVTTEYWLRAKDNAGNWSKAAAFTIKVDKTAPVISTPKESDEKTDNRYSISFTAEDYQDVEGKVAGSGVANVYYAKKSEVTKDTPLTDTAKYTEIKAENGTYSFTAADNVDYVIRAVDHTGNMTSIIDAYARHSEIAASVPTQMMFAVIPNAAEGFVTPDYTFTNLSTEDQVEVSVEKAVSKEGSELVLGKSDAKLAEDTMKLYAEKASASDGFGVLTNAIIYETSGDSAGCKTTFGKLAAQKSGTMRLKADTFGYSATEKALKKKGSWTLLLKLTAKTTI